MANLVLASCVGVLCATSAVALAQTPASKQTLYYIPHTHWEGAVFKTREEYLQMGLPYILKAVHLLKKHPDYRFTLDQVACIKPFVERYPEEAADFRKFVAEGRLGIVGGMDIMPDVVKPGGELLVRQMQYGKRWCREALGVEVTTAWLLDTFGHHPQMPQLLKLAGFKSFWFCRGVPKNDLPSEFLWRGIDGTDIQAFWLPGFYGLFYGPPADLAGFTKFFRERFHSLDSHAHGAERVGLAGVDVSEPEEHVTPLIRQFNESPNAPFAIKQAIPADFEAVVAKRKDMPVLSYPMSPIFQGTYSSRSELKRTTREIEQRLLTAEKLAALAALTPSPSPKNRSGESEMLWRAWEPVLFNQTHDLASGVMTDHVYEDVVRGYDFARKITEDVTDRSWNTLAARIDTRGEGVPIVVFNTLGWPRTDSVQVDVGFAGSSARSVEVADPAGKPVPSQTVTFDSYRDGTINQATISFVARDVPALGYATYHVIAKEQADSASGLARNEKDRNFIENEFYRVTFDRATGAVTSVFDKAQQWEALAGPGNVVSREQDRGDLWELYRGLDGGSYIAMTNRQEVAKLAKAQLSSEFKGTDGSVHIGPAYSEFRVSHPLGTGSFATRVRLYAGVRRVDIETELVNNEKYVRYQVLFPTAIHDGRHVQEIPFGAIERPNGIEFAAQHWVDYSDGKRGVALLNFGLPGNLVSEDTLLLSLMRSHNLGAYGYGGGYEPGMSSESGFGLGAKRTFHYALAPHAGDWREGAVYRDGLAFNHPLLARKVEPHDGRMPARWGLLEISAPNVVLTSITPGQERSMFLRVYEASGQPARGMKLRFAAGIRSAYECDLMERPGRRITTKRDTAEVDMHGFEIKTLKVSLDAPH